MRVDLTKDQIIPCLPDCPAHQDDYLHEEGDSQLILEALQEFKTASICVNLNIDGAPTLDCKWAFKMFQSLFQA
jgi:hypothetical protein